MQPTVCSVEGCDSSRVVKGMCDRHYRIARRRSQGVTPRKQVRALGCSVDGCDNDGYNDDPEVGVVCRVHYDRHRRTGTVELVGHKPRASCSLDGCEKPVHSKDLCQAHYRRLKRNGDPLTSAPVGRPVSTGNGHARLSKGEKERRRVARQEELASRTECVNGHPLINDNVYTDPGGKRICRTCQAAWLGRSAPITTSIHNRDKTHCKWGHDYAVQGYVKADGSRGCRPCERERHLAHTYGLERGGYDRMFAEQNGLCAICAVALEDGNNLAVDHDHETGVVRGLLCSNCNNGLGRFEDDIERLKSAVKYLQRGGVWRE